MSLGEDGPRAGGRVEQDGPTESCTETELDQPISASDASRAEEGNVEANNQSDSNGSSSAKKSKYQFGWRRIVRNFTPSWFVVNMGTGISSILLYNLPYNGRWLQYISYIIFALNVLLFVTFLFISLLRYTLYPKIWGVMIRHPAQSLFLGCFPMGFATIINMICFVCVPAWEGDWWKLAWALWWIDVVLATATCLYMPFIMYVHVVERINANDTDQLILSMDIHTPNLSTMTATWLLPIVATIVAAGSGAIVSGILPHTEDRLITVITSYILWGMGATLAMVVLVIYFLRLTTHQLVAKEVIVSTFLPLGPCGMGGFAIQELGNQARLIFRETQTLPASHVYAGDILYVDGFMIALVLWAFGLVWLFLALATIWRTPKFPFNMGWWGFTFPLGKQ
jgi:tellurite resistance protein TehA-like permease